MVEDRLLHRLADWCKERLRQHLADQTNELMKHKWIESEKARTDLGSLAAIEWVQKHAAARRRWSENTCQTSRVRSAGITTAPHAVLSGVRPTHMTYACPQHCYKPLRRFLLDWISIAGRIVGA